MKTDLKNILMVILSAFLSALAVKGFVEPANLYPAGFLGAAVLISELLEQHLQISVSYNLLYLLLNLLSTLLVLRVAGKKLILLSILQYGLVSGFLLLLPSFALVEDTLLLALFGGVLAGISCWLALDANASSGGTDFIAIYFSSRFHRSCFHEVMLFHIAILTIAGCSFGFLAPFYSMIYQFAVTKVIDRLHTRYQLIALHIITERPKQVAELIFQKTRHGITQIPAKGVFTGQDKTILYLICNQFEAEQIADHIHDADPHAFISETKAHRVVGQYRMERLA